MPESRNTVLHINLISNHAGFFFYVFKYERETVTEQECKRERKRQLKTDKQIK